MISFAVRIGERGVRKAKFILAVSGFEITVRTYLTHEAEDVVASCRISLNYERMAVISGHDDERIFKIDLRRCGPNRIRKGDSVGQRSVSIPCVAAVIDLTAFDHQEIALFVTRKNVDRLCCHLGERRFARFIILPVKLITHIRRLEEPDQTLRFLRIDLRKILFVPYVFRIVFLIDPFLDKVAVIEPFSVFVRVFRIGLVEPHEFRASAAKQDFRAVAEWRLDELAGDIRKTGFISRRIPFLDVGI